MSGLGEMLAAIAGHRTYELWRGPARFELEPRDADRIGYYRPISQGGQHRIDILRAHHCHARAPGETEVVPSTFTRPDVAIGDQPDF